MKQSKYRVIWQRFRRHRMAVGCLVILTILIVMAILAPVIAPYSPTKPAGKFSEPPTAAHWLGTDKIGRDMLSRILYAMRVSLLVGFLATIISTAIGVLLGLWKNAIVKRAFRDPAYMEKRFGSVVSDSVYADFTPYELGKIHVSSKKK